MIASTLQLALDAVRGGFTLCTAEAEALVAEIEQLAHDAALERCEKEHWRGTATQQNEIIERYRTALEEILKLTQDPRVYPNVAVITLKVEDAAVKALRGASENGT